jgi:cation:H+ antiporter
VLRDVVLFLLGLVVLCIGADSLVRGSARLARALGIAPVIVGLTIVAFGTSTPELVVSMLAAIRGEADIAVGNIVGSNIFNIAVILAVAALVRPLEVKLRLVNIDCPIMIFSAITFMVTAADGEIGRIDAAVLTGLFIGVLLMTVRQARNEPEAVSDEFKEEIRSYGRRGLAVDCVYILGGLIGLVGGGHLLVTAAVSMAREMGVSELVIGLTIVSAGTSLPELATSAIASYRKQPDIAIGNVIGSNLYNTLFIGGISALVHPLPVQKSVLSFDILVMLMLSAALWPILRTGKGVSRIEGLLLLSVYGLTLAYWLSKA